MVRAGNIVPRALEDLAQPHVESFDYFIGDGLGHLVDNMRPVEVRGFCDPLTYQVWWVLYLMVNPNFADQ